MLLVFNLPMAGIFANIIRTPLHILMPLVLLLCVIGVYAVSNSIFDVALMIAFGVLGYVMEKLDYSPAPLVLALVLGPVMERTFRESMMISRGDLGSFVTRPISGTILAIGVLVLIVPPLIALYKKTAARRATPRR
jgi:putative tricarboxylic transport membrane protein